MQDIQLYLNGQLCDLSSDDAIALTFQINNLAEIKNQQGNTSKQFKIPLTQNNRRILGYPDDIRITNELPYTQYSARIIQDGNEIVPNGLAECAAADNETADITVLSGNVDFFDQIDGKIYDMGDSTKPSGAKQPFSPYQHVWDLNTVVASRNKTDGYIYPVIDYGSISPVLPLTVDVRALRPAFFLKTAIDLIIGQTGYRASGRMFDDPLYNKIIIPFANDEFEHGTDYQTQPDTIGMIANNPADIVVSHIPIYDNTGILSFNNVASDPKGQYNGTTFTAQQIFTGTILVNIPRFYFRGRKNDTHPSTVDIIIFYQALAGGTLTTVLTYDLTDFTRVDGTSGSGLQGYWEFGLKKVSTDIDFQVGDQISIRYEFKGDRPAFFTLYSGATLTIKAKNEDVLFGQQIQCERIFPDITQKDLLKDNLQRFAILCQTDNTNKTINFASFKDIVKNIPIAKDWTDKCIDLGKQNTFKLGDYAQINNLKYKTDDAITDGYADDVINVDNKTLPASLDLIESQFAPSLNTAFAGDFVAQIRKIDEEAEAGDFAFTVSTSPRVLVDNKLLLYDTTRSVTINFTDGANTIPVNDMISAPYFHKLNGTFSLMWKDNNDQPGLRSLYYKELERILTRTKKVVRYFLLTPKDINELDLLVPVYLRQDNAYFYINQIFQWQKGVGTKIELIKIGEVL